MPTREIDVRRELAAERAELVDAVEELRATSFTEALRAHLPLLVVGGFAVGFVLSGGVGAVARLLFRRSREGREAARFGPYALVYRR